MSIASSKLEIIRQQVQHHLDREERKRLSPAREEELRERVKAAWRGKTRLSLPITTLPPPSRPWLKKPAVVSPTHWKWRALAMITPAGP